MRQAFILLLLTGIAFGQSFYNRLGYGTFNASASAYAASMGYATVAYSDSNTVLNANPAAWNRLRRVFFSSGGSSAVTQINLDGSRIQRNDTRFQTGQIAFPIGREVGFALGLEPVTDLNSEMDSESAEGVLSETQSGGIWRYYLGAGYRVTPKLSIGARLDILNGLQQRSFIQEYDSSAVATGAAVSSEISGIISGSSFAVGGQLDFTEKLQLGLLLDLPLEQPHFSGTVIMSGVAGELDYEEAFTDWPVRVEAGIRYRQSERLNLYVSLAQWVFTEDAFSEAVLPGMPSSWSARSMGALQLGLVRLPRDLNSRRIVERMETRLGFNSRNFYLTPVSGQLIYEYFAAGGFSLPLMERKSRLDASLEIGKRSGVEDYPDEWISRIRLGVQLNEVWFRNVKRR